MPLPARRMPTTPVFPRPVWTSRPQPRSFSATSVDVRVSWKASSGWAWMSRRSAVSSGCARSISAMVFMAGSSGFRRKNRTRLWISQGRRSFRCSTARHGKRACFPENLQPRSAGLQRRPPINDCPSTAFVHRQASTTGAGRRGPFIVQMTGADMPRSDRAQQGPFGLAARHGLRTARMEGAAGRRIQRRRQLALDRPVGAPARRQRRQFLQQRLRVRMIGALEDRSPARPRGPGITMATRSEMWLTTLRLWLMNRYVRSARRAAARTGSAPAPGSTRPAPPPPRRRR